MRKRTGAGWFLAGAALAGSFAATRAQQMLFAEHDGQGRVVRAAHQSHPRVEIEGKLVPANGQRLQLRAAEEFAPFEVMVRRLEVSYAFEEAGGEQLDKTLVVRGEFAAAWALPRVFLVLEFNSARDGNRYFLWELGDLPPHEPAAFNVRNPRDVRPRFHVYDSSAARAETRTKTESTSDYTLHLFSDGLEVFHSRMPPGFAAAQLEAMIARRVRGASTAGVRPFFTPAPEHPPALRAAGVGGTATIAFRVSTTGRPLAERMVHATAPEFGEAALAALSGWRFLPKIENGVAVETSVELPFAFEAGAKRKP